MGLTLLAATMCASVGPLSAAPSERIRINITLADGSQLEVTRMGDEHFTYYMTDEGETIVRDSLGYRLGEDDEERPTAGVRLCDARWVRLPVHPWDSTE